MCLVQKISDDRICAHILARVCTDSVFNWRQSQICLSFFLIHVVIFMTAILNSCFLHAYFNDRDTLVIQARSLTNFKLIVSMRAFCSNLPFLCLCKFSAIFYPKLPFFLKGLKQI